MRKYSNLQEDPFVAWLGPLPSHWKIGRVKHFYKEIDDRSKDGAEQLLSVSKYTGVTLKSDSVKDRVETLEGYKKCQPGDLVSNIMLAWNGSLGVTDFEGVVSPAYCVYRLNRPYEPKYFHYLFRADSYLGEFRRNSRGVVDSRLRLYTEDFFRIRAPIPSIEEQKAIVRYLDKKLEQIKTFIANKRRLIELLEEQKIAIINRVVTKGLDEGVPMKDSGVEWLGTIPKHWELRKVSRSFRVIGSGTTPQSGSEQFYKDGTINWANTGDLNDGWLYEIISQVTPLALDRHSTLKVYQPGTLLIAMYGATIGKVALLGIPACTNQACCALAESPYFDAEYLRLWFIANKSNVTSLAYGGGQPNISQEVIKGLRITCPPQNEQLCIVKHAQDEEARIKAATQKINQEITLIEEYRTTLISNVVTGKVDVRTAI